MGSERAALNHNCKVIRRQVLEEFSNLTLLFVVHAGSRKDRAIADEANNFLSYRGGQKILDAFKNGAKQGRDGFLGMIKGESRGIFGLPGRDHYYALFFVNAEDFKTMDAAQAHLYHLAWHAINLCENYSGGQGNARFKDETGFIVPRHTPLMLSTDNLMADVFTAILRALLENDYRQIRKMARIRAERTLSPEPLYRAELFPYPVAMETAELVYEDLKDTLDPKLKIYRRALELAHEVGLTHDEQSIKQWWAFSARAQEMAWMGANAQKILNAAIYTSEDPYVKATAYLVAEAMGIEPEMFTDAGSYNPFTDPEVNERAHIKLCEKVFKDVMSRVQAANDPDIFLEEAKKQNEKLKIGHISGWCAPALLALDQAWRGLETDHKLDNAHDLFIAARDTMPWDSMQKLAKGIMKHRRGGLTLSLQAMNEIAKAQPELLAAAQAFETTDGKSFKAAKEETAAPRYVAGRRDNDMPPIMAHLKSDQIH